MIDCFRVVFSFKVNANERKRGTHVSLGDICARSVVVFESGSKSLHNMFAPVYALGTIIVFVAIMQLNNQRVDQTKRTQRIHSEHLHACIHLSRHRTCTLIVDSCEAET